MGSNKFIGNYDWILMLNKNGKFKVHVHSYFRGRFVFLPLFISQTIRERFQSCFLALSIWKKQFKKSAHSLWLQSLSMMKSEWNRSYHLALINKYIFIESGETYVIQCAQFFIFRLVVIYFSLLAFSNQFLLFKG